MARNTRRYAYVTIGLPRDSHMLAALTADAAETGVSIAQIIAVRLADLYHIGPPTKPSEQALHNGQAEQQATDGTGLDPVILALQEHAREATATWVFDDDA